MTVLGEKQTLANLSPRQRPTYPVGRGEAVAHGVGFAGEGDLVTFARVLAAPID